MKQFSFFGIILIGIISLCWSVYRDVQIEKLLPSDLRNRVVGARLQKDGKLPYFYKWKPGDGIRYYDPNNFDSLRVATITASPFFHQLLYPVVEWKQRTISRFWVALQYVLLFIMTGMALALSQNIFQKMAVLAAAISFLYTEAWINLIAPGQNYLFIPFFAMLCYVCLRKTNNSIAAFFAGLFAISLVLIRPNTVIMFLPLLFMAGRFSLRYKVVFFVPVLLMLGLIAGSSFQRALWKDYANGLSEQLKLHQQLGVAKQINARDPKFAEWEGWNMAEVDKEFEKTSYVNYSENGNFFVLVRDGLHMKLSPRFLTISSFSLMGLLLLMFFFYRRKTGYLLFNLVIFGFCLYMLSDLFSPIFRHQYYTVQWFFPILLAASGYSKTYKWLYFVIGLGLILNIINSPYIKMEHSIGEYIIFAALLLLAFVHNGKQEQGHFSIQHS
ncbi:MAG: hypothetical protein IT250_17710 [Chitinophagaceae bacterium]|nr:hypothetical protein [Chitinophagaceae bacterium]